MLKTSELFLTCSGNTVTHDNQYGLDSHHTFLWLGEEGYLMTLSVLKATQHPIIGLLSTNKSERICNKSCPEERVRRWEGEGGTTTKTLIPDNQLSGQVFNHAPPKCT
jgi:hypothetical protein